MSLVRRESPALLDYFARRVRPVEDAADLLGDVLLVTWRRARAVPTDPVEARMWLYGVARRVLSQYRRGRGRQAALGEKLRQHLGTQATAASLDGRPRTDDQESIMTLIEGLPERDRELLTLVYWDGFRVEEAARILGLRAATARSRLARARARLREQLEARAS